MRKTPAQARGWRRVEAILDAAARLFFEQGYEAASMEAVAAASGTSIGSVYQFFEKKQDVFIALAHRCLADVRTLASQLTGPLAEAMEWPELIDASVDAFVALGREHPGFKAVNANLQLYGLFEDADAALGRELVKQAARVLAKRVKGLTKPQALRVATMIVTSINAVVFYGSRTTRAEADAMVEECKRMLRAYVGTYFRPDE